MSLTSVSPIDGRYEKYTRPLTEFFSEMASMRYKVLAECEYLIALSETSGVKMRRMSDKEKKLIKKIYENFSAKDAQIINDIELKGYGNIKATNHDLKAIEYFLKDRLEMSGLGGIKEWAHFGLTSEDAGNIGLAVMMSEGLNKIIIPALEKVKAEIRQLAKSGRGLAMLARTHGQPASPTTFGKEMKIYESRLERQLVQLRSHRLQAKLNGATGNYNALYAAYPKIDWIGFSEKLIDRVNRLRKINLEANLFTAQIEPHDSYAELFDNLRRANIILIDFSQDVWRYISDGWITQKTVAGEVGSSTMPHKINPIFAENCEGNLGMANAMLEFFSRKLPVSRLQRDLSDSTVLRNIGTAFGHSLVGYSYLSRQLKRIEPDKKKILDDLKNHPEVIAEAIQTILRREGAVMPYEKLKDLTRGRQLSMKDIESFIDKLDISGKVKDELKKIRPENYTGLAEKLAVL